jgi:DNA-directed RNA polymerase I, II, and III subunit RPABC2
MSKVIDEEEIDSLSLSSEETDDVYDEEDETDDVYDEEDEEEPDNINDVSKSLNPNYNIDEPEEYEVEVDETQYEIYEDEEPIENYLQKLNDNMKSNIITDFHPQLKPHNFEEIKVLTKIERDKNGDVIDDLHKTSPFMTKYERSRILAERTVQINLGAQIFLAETDIIDGYLIALEELTQKKIPFIIKRPLPNGAFEYWNAYDLELL